MQKLSSLFVAILFFPLTILYSQTTINIPGDYPTIQEGINAAVDGDLVLVAEGTYTENIDFKGKAITVTSQFYVDGNKSHIENTIIDGSQPANADTGSVVLFKSGEDTNSVLCGFTITGGSGTILLYGADYRIGGGIALFQSGAKICNNIITLNTIDNSTIYTTCLGGGIFAAFSPDLIISNNVINENIIDNNKGVGGGISSYYCGITWIVSNTIINNLVNGSVGSGGGIDIWSPGSETYVRNNIIKGNKSTPNNFGGGGIDIYNSSTAVFVSNNLIAGNQGFQGGGILVEYDLKGNLSKTDHFNLNSLIGNKNDFNQSNPYEDFTRLEAVIVNNTIIENNATNYCGGISCLNAAPDIKNCILWGNSSPQIFSAGTVEFSDIEGGYAGTGNIDSPPQFVGSQYKLLTNPASPCIDAGNSDPMYNDVEDASNPGNTLFPALGSLANDMGAFGGPNSTWSAIIGDTLKVPEVCATIQAAIDAAIDGQVVLVEEGTYYENINYRGKAITVASRFLVDGDTSHISNTIINGSQPANPDSASVVYFVSGEDTTSVLCGFTITGGTGTYNPVWTEFEGGGVYCSHAGAKIINNKIVDNEVIYSVWAAGGGIYMDYEETQRWIVIENNLISNNYVQSGDGVASGGGIFAGNNARIVNNVIEENTCTTTFLQEWLYGGGIGIDGSSSWSHTVYCLNNTIRNNKLIDGYYNGGAGIWMDDGNFYIEENLIFNNQITSVNAGSGQGAGILITSPDDECYINGNEFVNNNSDIESQGGALCIRDAQATLIKLDKNLVKSNSAFLGAGIALLRTIDVSITNDIFTQNEALLSGGAILFSNNTQMSKMEIDQSGRGTVSPIKMADRPLLYSQPVVINNTFIENMVSNGNGGAVYNETNQDLIMVNTIFWENEALTGKDLYQFGNSQMHIYHSNIETDSIYGNWSGSVNIYEDPLFVNSTVGDLHLQDASPCIGAGKDSLDISGTMYYCPPFCFHGSQRPNPAGSMPDIGACESPLADPVSVDNQVPDIPFEYSLAHNYPNPFNPVTTIKYGIPERTFVELIVYDVIGREVVTLVNREQPAGYYETNLNAVNLSSGVYFYQLRAGDFVQTRKMILLK